MSRLVIGIPGPETSPSQTIGSTEKEWKFGDEVISGWASPAEPSDWTYLWLEGARSPAFYRCYSASEAAPGWTPLVPFAEVFARTGYGDDEDGDDSGAELGAAVRLPQGTYKVDFLCRREDREVLLDGIAFTVPATNPGRGTILSIDLDEPQSRPWWKVW